MAKRKKRGKRRIKKKAITFTAIIIILIGLIFLYIYKCPITNIYILGNKYMSDEEIIQIAELEDYPSIMKSPILLIKSKLEKNIHIRRATVYKKGVLNQVYIRVYENYPLYNYNNETYLYDGKKISDIMPSPMLINEVPSKILKELQNCLKQVDIDILERISEIKYDPNDVDKKRFCLTMNDGIYVYATLNKFEKINDYDDIVSTLTDKKGILYLDSGEYFEVFKN